MGYREGRKVVCKEFHVVPEVKRVILTDSVCIKSIYLIKFSLIICPFLKSQGRDIPFCAKMPYFPEKNSDIFFSKSNWTLSIQHRGFIFILVFIRNYALLKNKTVILEIFERGA